MYQNGFTEMKKMSHLYNFLLKIMEKDSPSCSRKGMKGIMVLAKTSKELYNPFTQKSGITPED